MAIDKNAAVAKEMRTLFNIGVVRELTDGQLLERFATDRGEAAELAFAVLVERHGPMVLRVCRSAFGDALEVEDAFQATFLVLVRKARGLWVRDSLGPWLHQVAFRTASRARLRRRSPAKHEEHAAATRPEAHTVKSDDLGGLLHEEIEKLPERFRAPLVLCDLEGCSHEQAARHLGWPVGTVKSRQARGREKLRDRLRRRGLVPNVALLGSGTLSIGPQSRRLAGPGRIHDSFGRSICHVPDRRQSVDSRTRAGGSQSHVITTMVKGRVRTARVRRDRLGRRRRRARRAPAALAPARTNVEKTRTDEPVTFQATPGSLERHFRRARQLESARNQDDVLQR